MNSIIDDRKRCFICHCDYWIEDHHIFGGALRKKSERLGLKVNLCHWHHNEPPHGVHHNHENMIMLKQVGQRAAMQAYGWTINEFRAEFGKNYMEEENEM